MAGPALVRDIMKTPLIALHPIHSVREAAKIMMEKNIGSIIVIDERGTLLGIVTKTDIVRLVAKGGDAERTTIGEIMTKNPIYVFADTSLEEAARIMGYYGIGHLPVLNEKNNKPIGMISKRDILLFAPHYINLVYTLKKEMEASESKS
ncbi:MAG: CBS domain-containing protein [Acidilobaceae archaeon]